MQARVDAIMSREKKEGYPQEIEEEVEPGEEVKGELTDELLEVYAMMQQLTDEFNELQHQRQSLRSFLNLDSPDQEKLEEIDKKLEALLSDHSFLRKAFSKK